jgi:hypothetical protein
VWAPADVARRPFEVRSNLSSYRGYATNAATTYVNALPVCVPAAGHADITITASGSSSIPGDLSSYQASLGQRIGSIFLADASISDDLGRACKPATG